jgi:glutamyl-tRNA reductase
MFVANRTVARARSLVTELKAGEAFGLDELPALLATSDIVVTCTASATPVLDAVMVAKAQTHRRGRPLILLDIALPRDVEPECGKVDDVYLFDIDDLMQVVGANYDERRKAAEEAETLIERGVDAFRGWQRTLAVKPALASFRTYLAELVEKEAAKTLAREIFRDLTEKQRTALAALLDSIGGKIAADAARQVTNPPEGHYQSQLADALVALFPAGGGGEGLAQKLDTTMKAGKTETAEKAGKADLDLAEGDS